jgi:hypothetical protein
MKLFIVDNVRSFDIRGLEEHFATNDGRVTIIKMLMRIITKNESLKLLKFIVPDSSLNAIVV